MVTEKHEPPKTTDKYPPNATEQEKGKKDPVDKAVPLGTKPETMEDLGIGPRDPYPTGNPPPPMLHEEPLRSQPSDHKR